MKIVNNILNYTINISDKIVTVLGVDIEVNNLTRLIDDLDNEDEAYNQQYFNFSRMSVGDYIEVNAFSRGDILIASKLERKNDESLEEDSTDEVDEKAEPDSDDEQDVER